MLSSEEYIRISLEYNLFWVRIMKEHAVFIESALPASQKQLAAMADHFKKQFDRLLTDTIGLANGLITQKALQSGQYYTRFTEAAEQAVQQFTGIETNVNLTRSEYRIQPYSPYAAMGMQREREISRLNQNILVQVDAFARFKTDLLNRQSSCQLFTFLYTADVDHILREALRYRELLNLLQNRDERVKQNYKEFWNRNMSDHAKSMRGLFDPTETRNISEADRFSKIFDALMNPQLAPATDNTLQDTREISVFKAETTQGLLGCKVKAIMSALYTDHLLREANHFIYLLES